MLIIYIFLYVGIDDCVLFYMKNFVAINIDGRKLLNLDDDALKNIGITKSIVRSKIIQGINLLHYYVNVD